MNAVMSDPVSAMRRLLARAAGVNWLSAVIFVVLAGWLEAALYDFAQDGLSSNPPLWQYELAGWLDLARFGHRLPWLLFLLAGWAFFLRPGSLALSTESAKARNAFSGASSTFWRDLFAPLVKLLRLVVNGVVHVFSSMPLRRRRERWERIARIRRVAPGLAEVRSPEVVAGGWRADLEALFLGALMVPTRTLIYVVRQLARNVYLVLLEFWFSGSDGHFLKTLLLLPMRLFLAARRWLRALFRLLGPEGWAQYLAMLAVAIVAWFCSAFSGLLLTSMDGYLYRSPTVTRLLVARSSAASLPAVATSALDAAIKLQRVELVRAVLAAGSRDGSFVLRGYQEEKNGRRECRSALPAQDVQFVLDEAVDKVALLRAAVCALNPNNLQLAPVLAAFARHSQEKIDAHEAIATGHHELLQAALKSGAALESLDWRGRTPLMAAFDMRTSLNDRHRRAKQFELVEQLVPLSSEQVSAIEMISTLLKAGASHAVIDHAGRSMAYAALQAGWNWPADELPPPMTRTAMGATLLHAAAASGQVDLARRVVAHGVSVLSKTDDGRTAMHFAHEREMVRYLRDLELNPNALDGRGRTPFHTAVIAGDIEAARVFSELAHDREAPDIFGKAPLDYAPRKPADLPAKSAKDEKDGKDGVKAEKAKSWRRTEPEWQQWQRLANRDPELFGKLK